MSCRNSVENLQFGYPDVSVFVVKFEFETFLL